MKVLELIPGLAYTGGDVGLEIELEGKHISELATDKVLKNWRFERDGSLRGMSYELVLRDPLSFEEAIAAVRDVEQAKKEDRSIKILDTGRAGVHVHVNMQHHTMTQVFNMITLYMIFEDQLVDYCGDHRVGNLFCLRVRDADDLIKALRKAAQKQDWGSLGSDNLRYAALNVNSLNRYGSLEFRAMRSTICSKTLETWVGVLLSLRDVAASFDNPIEIIREFSIGSPRAMYDKVFREYPNVVPFNAEQMYDGMRRAQHLAFAVEDWDIKDPFEGYAEEFKDFDEPDFLYNAELRSIVRDKKLFMKNQHRSLAILSSARTHLDHVIIEEDEEDDEEPEDDEGIDPFEELLNQEEPNDNELRQVEEMNRQAVRLLQERVVYRPGPIVGNAKPVRPEKPYEAYINQAMNRINKRGE